MQQNGEPQRTRTPTKINVAFSPSIISCISEAPYLFSFQTFLLPLLSNSRSVHVDGIKLNAVGRKTQLS